MRRVISVICVLIAAALVFAGAVLPRLSAAAMDRMKNNKTGSAPIQSVELNLNDRSQQNSTQSEDMVRKMRMEQRMFIIPIDPSEASMTEDEVYAAMESCMEDYVQAGIFEWFPYTFRVAEPILGIDGDDISNMSVLWTVNYVNEQDPYQSLFLHIDDETGRILYLRYENYETEKMNTYPQTSPEYADRMNAILGCFVQIFFDQLGLSNIRQYYDIKGLVETEEVDGGIYLRQYLMGDEEYGELIIEFYALPGGFYLFYKQKQ